MPKTPQPNQRAEGRAVFLEAMAPLRVAQQEGYRQGLLKAAELIRQHPDRSGLTLSRIIEKHADELPAP